MIPFKPSAIFFEYIQKIILVTKIYLQNKDDFMSLEDIEGQALHQCTISPASICLS